ncbi:nucleoporin NUP35 [Clarias gariepinus]|uniref:nucleoporin NUP35 n=1 Tax=Clarias gariepinus TaxID=13013 RepID=UPI00234D5788|nr:nucleoporin NUP35 [Clarias gariepinus]
MEIQGMEPMSLGSPSSPKPVGGAQFLPGFLMGDLPAPATPQPRPLSLGVGGAETRASPFTGVSGGSPPQPVVPTPKDKSGAPPVRSIYDDLSSPVVGFSPLTSRKQGFSMIHTPLSGLAATPGSGSVFSPASLVQVKNAMSPAQVDPFFTQGDALSSEDQLDDTWVTVFGFPPASASYILLQFAQYGNILKHVMSNSGNWMHIQYQSKLQARKALSKDGKIFGEAIMIGVKPCIDKSVMTCSDRSGAAVFTPPVKNNTSVSSISTPRSAMRPLSTPLTHTTAEYQVVSDKGTPRKDDSFVSKAMEYMFGW